MTECLLVTDVTLDGVHDAAGAPDAGVCVGTPIGSNRVLVSALDADGRATGAPTAAAGVLGEIVVSAPHLKDHYDRLWLTDRAAVRDTVGLEGTPADARWHRTGDVGHLDDRGRLWVEGRMPHVIVAADGPIAPVGPEQQVERVAAVRRAAVVGVGPHGLRQAVAVRRDPAAGRASGPRRPGASPARYARAPASRSSPCSPFRTCPPTSGTTRRSTGRGSRCGRTGSSPARGPSPHDRPRHRRLGVPRSRGRG